MAILGDDGVNTDCVEGLEGVEGVEGVALEAGVVECRPPL
jgi:hypothetical protein